MLVCAPANAQEPGASPKDLPVAIDVFSNISLSTGIDYSSGNYGQSQSTDILVGLTSLAATVDSFQLSASLPYLNITSPEYVVIGPGGDPVLVSPKRGASSTGRSGWGDLSLSVTYSVPSEILDDWDLTLGVRTKIATADVSKGLSTGSEDYAFSVDVSHQWDIWSPFVTFGYRFPGSAKFYAFNNAPSFSVGTTIELSDSLVAITSYDFDGSISSSLADSQQLFESVSWLLNDRWTITAYAEKGLSSGSPSIGTGLLIGCKLF
jgi:hypothetical protein